MTDLNVKELEDLRTANVFDEQCERAHDEIKRHRSMLNRLNKLVDRLGRYSSDATAQFWAAELRAAITGRKFLYRCLDHGDRPLLSMRHDRVCCGEVFRDRLGTCTKDAELVGEVDAQD
jgi:hypothetical protein